MTENGSGRLRVDALTKRFGSVAAVENLTFVVEPGTVTGFLGPNGSGKTTTLRMLLGLVAPTAGEALVEGVPYRSMRSPARVVGAVLEAQGFHPARSGRKHLSACAAAIGVADSAVDTGLAAVGLTDAADRSVGGYSLGMRQRLSLAVAMLGEPRILVLDEPGNGLDPEGIAWLRSFLRGFAAAGHSVLVSSHLLGEVEKTADHVVVISSGRCVFQGALAQLRSARRARTIVVCPDPIRLAEALNRAGIVEIDRFPDGRLGVADADPVRVGDIALAAGVAVHGLVEERIDLEQLYFQLTAGAGTGPWAP
jgi:ABC-2 type transport system ATP-binding protein